jgi:hypothetical protein
METYVTPEGIECWTTVTKGENRSRGSSVSSHMVEEPVRAGQHVIQENHRPGKGILV